MKWQRNKYEQVENKQNKTIKEKMFKSLLRFYLRIARKQIKSKRNAISANKVNIMDYKSQN